MSGNKVIDKLLQYSDVDPEKYHFNPLLFEEVAEKVSGNLCKTLASSPENDNTELKKEIRKGLVEITRRLCKRENAKNIFKSQTKYDIIVKNIKLNKSDNCIKPSKYNKENHKIYDKLNIYSYENLNGVTYPNHSINLNEIELGIALSNINTEICNKAMSNIVEKCLYSNNEFDKPSLEFLRKVWENKNGLSSLQLYDYLTVKLLYIFKEEILNIASNLSDYDEDPANYTHTVNSLLNDTFPHFSILSERLADSSYVFCEMFRLLSKILVESNYNVAIETIIKLMLENVRFRCLSKSLTHLYPQHLNSIVLLLENDPESIKSVFMFYAYILEMIKSLHENSKEDFFFLMSHYEIWMEHYSKYYNFKIK